MVASPQPDEVDRIIKDTCLNCGARLIRVGSDITWQSLGFNFDRQLLQVKGGLDSYQLSIPLLGHYQLDNAATAVAALEVLAGKGFNIFKDSIINGLAQVSWPGRFQILSRHPLIVVDGAHNPYSARALNQSLEQYFHPERATLIIGASSDKDIAGIASELAPMFDKVIATRSQHPRAMASAPIVAEFVRHGVETQVTNDIPTALSLALAGDKDLICVTGSLFIVAEAIEEVNSLRLTV